jgi:hypothetical protein
MIVDNSHSWNINNSQYKICKQLWSLGNKYLVIIDNSIIEKLGITETDTIFLEQEITHDNTIVMRIKKF